MISILRNYFQLLNSFWGEVYFRVSKHLGVSIIEVIRKKFLIEYKSLIMYYSQELRYEIKEHERLEEEQKRMRK